MFRGRNTVPSGQMTTFWLSGHRFAGNPDARRLRQNQDDVMLLLTYF
jgi:hypothetical protein